MILESAIGLALSIGAPAPTVVQGVPMVVSAPAFIDIGHGEFLLFLPDGTVRRCQWSEAKR